MSSSPLGILLVDDHVMVRAGLRALIEREPGLSVVGETGDATAAVRLAVELRADVVLMDLRPTDSEGGPDAETDGAAVTRRLVAAVPRVNVVMLSSHSTGSKVVRAIEAGARGYVLKESPPEELFRAIRTAASGGIGLAPEAARLLVGQAAAPAQMVSDREIEVIRLLARGLTNRAIASALFLTEATVKTHLVHVYRKLGTGNRAGAVSEAVRRGLVELG
ncbi:response regulator [Streptomyces sp. NPDC057474]|uniref:response regulator n=1 Tax=Streptomyces sp. NPDC057474 TaxID=3346144 RepID=UPI0036A60856